MKQANRCSKQAGVCFKAERCLFKSRQAPAIKRRTHLSEQSDTSFKQPILFRLILQARMSTNPEMISSEEISAILKQSAVCLRQVDACSNRPTSDSNRGVPCFVSLKFKRNNFVQNQPRQASTLVLVILVCKMPLKYLLKTILKEDHCTLLLSDGQCKTFQRVQLQ